MLLQRPLILFSVFFVRNTNTLNDTVFFTLKCFWMFTFCKYSRNNMELLKIELVNYWQFLRRQRKTGMEKHCPPVFTSVKFWQRQKHCCNFSQSKTVSGSRLRNVLWNHITCLCCICAGQKSRDHGAAVVCHREEHFMLAFFFDMKSFAGAQKAEVLHWLLLLQPPPRPPF